MGTILKNVLRFEGLAIGVPVSLPHLLNVKGIPVAPRIGGANVGGFTFTADATNVTATRQVGSLDPDVDVYVEYWHTIEAVIPQLTSLVGLTPLFFATGGSGGSGPQIARGHFSGADGSTISSDGCSAARNSNGNYTVTFTPGFLDSCAPVATLADDPAGTIFGISVTNISANSCDVLIYGNSDGYLPEDMDFTIVAVATTAP